MKQCKTTKVKTSIQHRPASFCFFLVSSTALLPPRLPLLLVKPTSIIPLRPQRILQNHLHQLITTDLPLVVLAHLLQFSIPVPIPVRLMIGVALQFEGGGELRPALVVAAQPRAADLTLLG
jgi:hypothetical protein